MCSRTVSDHIVWVWGWSFIVRMWLIYYLSEGPSCVGSALLDGCKFWPPVKYDSVWPFNFSVEEILPTLNHFDWNLHVKSSLYNLTVLFETFSIKRSLTLSLGWSIFSSFCNKYDSIFTETQNWMEWTFVYITTSYSKIKEMIWRLKIFAKSRQRSKMN